MEKNLSLSVHQLVDFLLRRGDIDNRIYNQSSMNEGTRLHAIYQKMQNDDYISEYHLIHTFVVDDFKVTLQGRADGIINNPLVPIIDEIKTCVIDLEEFYESQKEWHLGQAKVYALIYALDHKLDKMGVRLTYIHQLRKKEMMIKGFQFTKAELQEFVENLIREYLDFYRMLFTLKEERNASARELSFPFSKYRSGQKELAKYTYLALNKGTILYAEAPTGIGKTMSTLFPSCKTFANDENDKIFYLTAKTSGRESAYNAAKLLKDKGLKASLIMIMAKEKICACKGRGCNPDECPFAKGYYDRIKDALYYSVKNFDLFSYDKVIELAKQFQICPFEFQLDLSLFCDIIVCDFNYLFDPIVYMRRFFDGDASRFVALIDEAHNLVERSRDMYSCSLSFKLFKEMKRSVSKVEHPKLKAAIKKLHKMYKNYEQFDEGDHVVNEIEEVFMGALMQFQKAAQDFMKKNPFNVDDIFKECFFEINRFIKIYDFFDEHFTSFITKNSDDLKINIMCMDSSKLIRDSLNILKGAVLFSGTLSPLDYYVKMLGGDDKSAILQIPSPFPIDNLCLMLATNVATSYKKRAQSYERIAKYIKSVVKAKVGNYFVFFPSYLYMSSVLACFDDSDCVIHIQSRDMDDVRKNEFLDSFKENPDETHIGFVVLGGSFSEGIDLVSNRLIGAIIVGVGLPQISFERDLIKEHFINNDLDGFSFAYMNPGMNRVMQAVGRVIRSETDKGVVLLIDERYGYSNYHRLFKSEWRLARPVFSSEEVHDIASKFWKSNEE